jgi:hypothetical protein
MEEQKKSIYIETTIPSYATSRGSSNIVTLARQFLTKKFWEEERSRFDLYTSQYTIDECSDGDPEAAQKRLDFLLGIPVYPKTDEIEDLANLYFRVLFIPEKAKTDCFHLATCVITKVNYLLTWNLAHFGPETTKNVIEYNTKHGLWIPVLITPEYLLEIIGNEEKSE